MLQGLAMYDGQQRLVVCTSAMARCMPLARAGEASTQLREIIEHRIANGDTGARLPTS